MNLSNLDLGIFAGYIALIIGVGLWVSRTKDESQRTSGDYFLASKSLPWWAIGASLIASNISAEQFIGMSGSGYAIGLAIASYEWMAAMTLIIVAKLFLPIFIKDNIFTMPQFLQKRYGDHVRTTMAIFWIGVYIFVNLTSVLYLGALALETIMNVPMWYGMIGLALFSAVYSIYGGLKAVAWTDVIQVIFLVGGGLLTTYIALNAVSDGHGAWAGLMELTSNFPQKFDMILDKSHPSYIDLPGIGVLVGGLWIANLSYWGCNQYIVQRALAAENLQQAQRGIVFAAFLKILLPIIVVLPGIAAYALQADINVADEAYPWLLSNFVPNGIKGIAFAALIAAVVSSLSSMINSISTIFTMDIYKNYMNKDASEHKLVSIGRTVGAASLVLALITAKPILGGLDQAFQYIQEYTGFVSPAVVVIFVFGLFWKKANEKGALAAVILSIPLSVIFKMIFPLMPFMDRMGYLFIILSVVLVAVSLISQQKEGEEVSEPITKKYNFKTDPVFNVSALMMIMVVTALYYAYW